LLFSRARGPRAVLTRQVSFEKNQKGKRSPSEAASRVSCFSFPRRILVHYYVNNFLPTKPTFSQLLLFSTDSSAYWRSITRRRSAIRWNGTRLPHSLRSVQSHHGAPHALIGCLLG